VLCVTNHPFALPAAAAAAATDVVSPVWILLIKFKSHDTETENWFAPRRRPKQKHRARTKTGETIINEN